MSTVRLLIATSFVFNSHQQVGARTVSGANVVTSADVVVGDPSFSAVVVKAGAGTKSIATVVCMPEATGGLMALLSIVLRAPRRLLCPLTRKRHPIFTDAPAVLFGRRRRGAHVGYARTDGRGWRWQRRSGASEIRRRGVEGSQRQKGGRLAAWGRQQKTNQQ